MVSGACLRDAITRPRHTNRPTSKRSLDPLQPLDQRLPTRIQRRPRAPQHRQLHGHPRLIPLADVGQRLRQRVDRARQGQLRQRRGLGPQPLGVGGRDHERVRRLADRLDHDQLPQVSEQVAGELGHVAAGGRQPLGDLERDAAVAGGDRVGGAEDQVGVGDPEHREHVIGAQLLAAVGDELVEGPERIAEAAGGRARDRADRAVGDLDLLGGRDPADHLGDLLQRRALEVEALAAVDDRRHHLVRLGGREHEDGVRRRLLERLQERVPGLAGEHVGLVEDVDLPAPGRRRVADPLAQVADVVDRAIRGGVHLDHVERAAGGDRQARLALAARAQGRAVDAVERAGEDLRQRGLAGATRADEQVGVVDAVALDRVREGAHHVLLADDLVEGLRAVAAVERRLAGHRSESSARVEPAIRRCATSHFPTLAPMSAKIERSDLLITATGSPSSSARWPSCTGGSAAEEPRAGSPSPPTHARPTASSTSADGRGVQSGNKIEAIKLYRELTGAGLEGGQRPSRSLRIDRP